MAASALATERENLERLYAANPGKYRRKVVGLIALGYGYIVLVALVVLGWVIGGSLLFLTGVLNLAFVDNFIRISIPVLVVSGLMARAIFVRVPAPDGVPLTGPLKDAVVKFFEDVRVAANGQRIDHVIVDIRLNAAVQQVPRYGLFGPSRSYLILGAPLLQLMTPREVKAVVAHEFGHLSHEHGRLGAAVYRLNQTLANAYRAIERKYQDKPRPPGGALRFLRWFAQRFDRVTFVMRRGQEFEADAVAARTASADALATALCKLYALDAPLGVFWSGVWKRARRSLSNRVVSPMREMHARPLTVSPDAAADAIDRALGRETDFFDTHPALRERLRNMKVDANRGVSVGESALDSIFSAAERKAFFELVDTSWQAQTRDEWSRTHDEYVAADKEMGELARRAASLDSKELYRLARLQEDLDGLPAARDTFHRLAAAFPDDAKAQFHWGRVQIGDAFESAEVALHRAIELDINFVPSVVPLLKAGYDREGRTADLARLETYTSRFEEVLRRADAEREVIKLDDELITPVFTDEQRTALKAHIEKHDEIRKVYIVEKKTTAFQHHRVFLLAFDVSTMHDNVEVDEKNWRARIADSFATALPFLNNPFAIIVAKKSKWAQLLRSVEGALIYERRVSGRGRIWSTIKIIYAVLATTIGVAAVLYLAYDWLVN